MNAYRLGMWLGWVVPILLGALMGLLVRRAYVDLDDATGAVLPATAAPRAGTGNDDTSDATPAGRDRVDLGGVQAEPQPTESLEDVLAEITRLEQRLDELTGGVFLGTQADQEGWFEPDEETLKQWAACAQLPVDVPSALFRHDGVWFSDDALQRVDATDDEREALARAADEFGHVLRERIVALHEQIVDSGPVGDRPTHALIADLRAMQAISDPEGLDRKLVAFERAGQPPPEERGSQDMIPFYRELLRIGDDLEDTAATVLGKERARMLRRAGNGWGARMSNPCSQ